MSTGDIPEPDPEREGQDQYIRDTEAFDAARERFLIIAAQLRAWASSLETGQVDVRGIVAGMRETADDLDPIVLDTQFCDRCEALYPTWPAGRSVVSKDNRGMCATCVIDTQKTGATIDVSWFPDTQWHEKKG